MILSSILGLIPQITIACKFYIHNNSQQTVCVYDATMQQLFEIRPKKKQIVGDPIQHAHCTVYYKSSPDKVAEFRMIACATPGMSTDVMINELINDDIIPEIFEIIPFDKTERTAVKKTGGCSACQARKNN